MNALTDSKPKLEVLDALRGFCALAVMLLHLTEMKAHYVIPHGYFPVEYFFTLTGFTFVYAYDSRWKDMSVWAFFKRRLLRMQPLVILGSLTALVALCFAPSLRAHFGTAKCPALWIIFLYSCTLLPAPSAWGCIHVLQGPMWTMQYIYVANIVYAFVLRHLKTWMLALLAVAAAALSCWMSLQHGRLEAGWVLSGQHVSIAFTRLAFPVLAGMLIARLGWRIRLGNFALPVTVALLAALFFTPHIADKTTSALFDAGVAIIAMPLVVMTAAGGTISNAKVAGVCRWLGKFSFPLFATHFQFRCVMGNWLKTHPNVSTADAVLFGLGTAAVMFAFAYAAMRLVDAFGNWRRKK